MKNLNQKETSNYNIKAKTQLISPTVKPSKQLKYYYRHKELINTKRRINYQLTKPQKPKKYKITKKPNDVKSTVNSLVNNPITKAINSHDKPILTLFELLDCAIENLTAGSSDTRHIVRMKTPYIFVLPEIVRWITFCKELSFNSLELHFKDNVSKHQLKKAVQLLVNLKWLLRSGKGDLTVYYPNPFISAQYDQNPQWLELAEYARLKIDFFNLLNLPLINLLRSNQRIVKTKIEFHKFKLGSHALWIRAFFEGFVNIELHAENGDVYQTLLPVNLHASPKIEWKDGKRTQNRYGFPHHTLPLSWSLFDITEGQQYTKARRTSRWQKELENLEYIHFDTSFKILHYVDNQQKLAFKKPFKYALMKWNNDQCEYVEVGDFKTLEKLFYYRFVENKRRKELFEALGLKYKPISGRPKKII